MGGVRCCRIGWCILSPLPLGQGAPGTTDEEQEDWDDLPAKFPEMSNSGWPRPAVREDAKKSNFFCFCVRKSFIVEGHGGFVQACSSCLFLLASDEGLFHLEDPLNFDSLGREVKSCCWEF